MYLLLAAASSSFLTSGNLATVGSASGVPTSGSLPQIIGAVIGVVLSLTGLLLLGILLYAGILWMTAGGTEDRVKKAQTMIKNAVIGLVITVAAYAISTFVLEQLLKVTTQTPGGQEQQPSTSGSDYLNPYDTGAGSAGGNGVYNGADTGAGRGGTLPPL